jgi:hypothetical protein
LLHEHHENRRASRDASTIVVGKKPEFHEKTRIPNKTVQQCQAKLEVEF